MRQWGMADYIRYYSLKHFLSVIPLKPMSKEAFVPWKNWEEKPVPKWLIGDWYIRYWSGPEPCNIGLICGPASDNLVVIDWDKPEIFPKPFKPDLPERTLVWRTGRGYQAAFKLTKPVRTVKVPKIGLEVRCYGAIAVCPPSIHPTGRRYEFISDPEKIDVIPRFERSEWEELFWDRLEKLFGVTRPATDLSSLPGDLVAERFLRKAKARFRGYCAFLYEALREEGLQSLIEELKKTRNLPEEEKWLKRRELLKEIARLSHGDARELALTMLYEIDPPCIRSIMEEGAREGWRNEAAIRLASHLIVRRGWRAEKALDFLLKWNEEKCRPPLPEKEIHYVVKSVVKHGYRYGCRSMPQSRCRPTICPVFKRFMEKRGLEPL